MSTRPIQHRYTDPVDLVWLHAAERLGMRVQRSSEVYASWDGKGTLLIADQQHFDADDSLAQMIFHELCHALVAGDARQQPDWGLSADGTRDLVFEHACHRLQATLAARYGLRDFMAVTTEWRPYWDALPTDPLRDDEDPATPLAQRAFERAQREPTRSVMEQALAATARIADVVRASAPADSLWQCTRPRHSTGFLLGQVPGRLCGQCTWCFVDEAGEQRCRRTAKEGNAAQRVAEDEAACELWEATLTFEDCGACGACCRQGFDLVPVEPGEVFARRHPELVTVAEWGSYVPRPGGRCGALAGTGSAAQPFLCRHYSERPEACADFPISGDACLLARRRVGLSRL